MKQAERDAGKRIDRPTSAEREELGRLRRENHRLRQERDILAKAAAWFARESNSTNCLRRALFALGRAIRLNINDNEPTAIVSLICFR